MIGPMVYGTPGRCVQGIGSSGWQYQALQPGVGLGHGNQGMETHRPARYR